MTSTRPTRTYIIGGTAPQARNWCRENGIQPYARTTHIITHEAACRGHVITDDDRLVDLGGPLSEALRESLRLAMFNRTDAPPRLP